MNYRQPVIVIVADVSPESPLTNVLNFVTHKSKGFDLRTTEGFVLQRLEARTDYVHVRHLA